MGFAGWMRKPAQARNSWIYGEEANSSLGPLCEAADAGTNPRAQRAVLRLDQEADRGWLLHLENRAARRTGLYRVQNLSNFIGLRASDMNQIFPKLHNAMWPGLVGKGPGSEPDIDLDTMLDLTAAASVNGARFDGVDLFLSEPHVDIDSSDSDIERLADKIRARGFVAGSLVAPVWPNTGGGSAMGARTTAATSSSKSACVTARRLWNKADCSLRRDSRGYCERRGRLGQDPLENNKRIAETLREACEVCGCRRAPGGGRRDLLGRHA